MKIRSGFVLAFALGLLTPLAVWKTVSAQTNGSPHGDIAIDCGECHTADGWKPLAAKPTFRHDTTGFLLKDAHAQADCRACHRTLVFSRVGTACADCHRDVHRGDLGFRCEDCHDGRSWTNTRLMRERHNRTRLPLLGVHANLDCDSCHRGATAARYAMTPVACGACHTQTYQNAKNPDHAARRFSTRCEDCHTSSGWRPATGIDHDTTRFPLRGAHQPLRCTQCHTGGRYAGTPTDCVSCHLTHFNATTNPNHVSAGFQRTCQDCHSVTAWKPAANVDHSKTRFPLTGAHRTVDCARCHTNGRFAGTSTACASCHRTNYDTAANPNHASAGFPTTCEDCHTTSAWRPAAAFDHSRTRFALTGAHQRADCARCHTNGRYAGTPTDCVSCHRSSYDSATNPNHQSSGFPTTCQNCHSTSAWRPANFNHDSTRFPLTGAHRNTDCARCHPGGRYSGTSTSCSSCHQSKYDATTNPNHRSAGFPTSCQDCHSTSTWSGATFDHDARYFPISSGKHRGISCSTCHPNPGNYSAFNCLSCHGKSSMDSEHRSVRGYSYDSASCYRCHPRGTN